MARPRHWPGFRKILAEILKLWPCDAESRCDGLTRNRERRCDAESQGGSGDRDFARCKRAISCRSASETSAKCRRNVSAPRVLFRTASNLSYRLEGAKWKRASQGLIGVPHSGQRSLLARRS